MRPFSRALGAAAAVLAACASLPGPALANAGLGGAGGASSGTRAAARTAGAVQAPSAPLAGGSEYGVASGSAPGPPPVVSTFAVPSAALPGRPPRVSLRIDSTRAGTVRVRVVVYVVSVRDPVIAVDMGWVHTARTVTVRWPRGARLAPGTYHVSVGAHGHRVGPARQFAHAARTATLTVSAPPAALQPAPTPQPLPAGVPTPAQSAALGAVFPVAGAHSFGGPENRFGAPRAGRVHEGQDVLTAEGTPVIAPLAGVLIAAAFQSGGAGYYLAEHTSVGLDFFFAHCQAGSLLVKANDAVAASQQLCAAGQTGNATTPHLHFEVWVGGWRARGGYPVDPLPYLEAWERPHG